MPEEVSYRDGLSGASQEDAAMLVAAYQGRSLKDKQVVDVNGTEMGRIVRAFGEAGSLTRFDVHLTNNARRLFRTDRTLAGVPADAIAHVEENTVRLLQAGEQIIHPAAPLQPSFDERGAPELPRKERRVSQATSRAAERDLRGRGPTTDMDDNAKSDAGPDALRADDLLDKRVFDVNGHALGRVNLTRERGEQLLSFDVVLGRRARRQVGLARDRLTLAPSDILSTDFDVTLDDDLAHLARPHAPERIE